MNKWKHKRPRDYYDECVKMFGSPTAKANVPNGFALWKTKGLFHEHLLRDEDVKHCVPRNHHDYFYSSVKFYVPAHKLFDVLRISGSINYDGLKNLLTARCGGIGANYATLYLGMMVANGDLSIQTVKQSEMYSKMIKGELIPHKEIHTLMNQLKQKNHKQYKKELLLDYAPYAFSKCYTRKKSSISRKKTRRKK